MENIGKRIKLARLKLGLSQAKFAHLGGVATNAQGHYESGYRRPRADYLFKLGVAGVDIGFLVTGIQPASTIDQSSPQSMSTDTDDTELPSPLAQIEAQAIEYLHHSLDSIARALVTVHQLKDHRDQRTPADHIREYLTLLDAEPDR